MNERLLRSKLALKGLTVKQFAEKIGVNRATYYRWRKDPGLIQLNFLQKAIQVLDLTRAEALDIFMPESLQV